MIGKRLARKFRQKFAAYRRCDRKTKLNRLRQLPEFLSGLGRAPNAAFLNSVGKAVKKLSPLTLIVPEL